MSERPKVLCVIPARLESKRLPGKVLLSETGKPLIQHVWENAVQSLAIDQVSIATDDRDLQHECMTFCAHSILTCERNCGTDRVAEVSRSGQFVDFDIVINLQADEPDITGEDLDQLVLSMLRNPKADMATMAWKTNCAKPVTNRKIVRSRDNVKVVFSGDQRALYFSRSPIPPVSPWWIHAGVYAFRRDFLLDFAAQPQSRLEKAENLEQLRALEMGAHIHVEPLAHEAHGINTAADYRRFVRRQLQPGAC